MTRVEERGDSPRRVSPGVYRSLQSIPRSDLVRVQKHALIHGAGRAMSKRVAAGEVLRGRDTA